MTATIKSSLFRRAWEIVRVTRQTGTHWTFSMALKEAWSELKAGETFHWPASPAAVAKSELVIAENVTRYGSYGASKRIARASDALIAAA